jgi:hypothetical protein
LKSAVSASTLAAVATGMVLSLAQHILLREPVRPTK